MSKVVCSCGWSWNKSDSSKKDMYVCHNCGNANAKDSMKNGGWLDAYNEEVPQAQNGIEGTMAGLTDKGFNYNGAWGGQFQNGGNKPKKQNTATRQDSLALYNKSKEVEQWYKENGYKPDKDNPVIEVSKALEDNDFYYKTYQGAGRRVDKGIFESEDVPKNEYRKVIDKNKYYQRENADIWLNTDSPMQLYDKRIQPRNSKAFMRGDDAVSIRSYNNIANKPFDLLTEKEKAQRVKQYGTNGVPKSYLNKITTPSLSKQQLPSKSAQKSSKQPLVVESKNDPRYKTIHTGEEEGRFELIERPKIKGIQNNLQPEGLVQSDTELNTDVSGLRPQARVPKYFNVTDRVNQNFGGSETSYKYYPENGPLQELAPEPYNTRTMVPQYQDGGNVNNEDYNMKRALELGYTADESGHWPSVDYETGEWLKSKKHHTRGMELMAYELNPELRNKYNLIENEKGKLQYVPKLQKIEEYQTGGSMPGSVGFTYARTKGIPSEGPYAKKTLPSAQNGQEMKYYQEGLDWKPKTISQNGSYITGDKVTYGTPEYTEAYNKGEVVTDEGVRSPIALDEVVIQNNYRRPRGFWEQYADKIAEENKDAGVLGAIIGVPISAITSFPQLAATYALTDKMQRPSEAIDIENPYGAMAVDAIADPANLIGAGILTKGNTLGKPIKKLLAKGVLPVLESTQSIKNKAFDLASLYRANNKKIMQKAIEDVNAGNAWSRDWYSNPIIQKRYDEWISSGNKFMNPKDALLHSNMMDVVNPSVLGINLDKSFAHKISGTIARNNLEKLITEGGVTKPVTSFGNQRNMLARYNHGANDALINVAHPGFNKGIFGKGFDIGNTTVHENIHSITKGDEGFKPEYLQKFKQPFKGLTNLTKHQKYLIKPTEVHARIGELRRTFGLSPETIVDDKLMDHIINQGLKGKTSVEKNFFKLINDKNSFKQLMNTAPAGVIGVGLGAGALQQQKEGGIIKDDRGQWAHPGEITEIGSNNITMQGVPYPVLGISDTGDTKLMQPGGKYKYKGNKVTEFPMAKNGLRQEQKGLRNLDDLTNFTNYNKSTGWLSKYE